MDEAETVLSVRDLSHAYVPERPVLSGISLSLARGNTVAVQGPSGVGKTTLLEIMGTMRTPTSGEVHLMGESVYEVDLARRAGLRGRWLGFVFQEALLLPDLTIWENCRLAVVLADEEGNPGGVRARFEELMAAVGLDPDRADDRPSELSTGERQRLAMVRSLMHRPSVLIADEPTGNLDPSSGGRLVDLLLELGDRSGAAVLVATHDPGVAKSLSCVYRMEAGQLNLSSGSPPGSS